MQIVHITYYCHFRIRFRWDQCMLVYFQRSRQNAVSLSLIAHVVVVSSIAQICLLKNLGLTILFKFKKAYVYHFAILTNLTFTCAGWVDKTKCDEVTKVNPCF